MSELLFLDDQVSKLQTYTGSDDWPSSATPLKLSQRIQQTISRLPKDIQSKYQKIRKLINNYSRVIDDILPQEKVETVQSEEEEMNEVAQQLEEIEQLSKYLNMDALFNGARFNEDIAMLETASRVEFVDVKEPLKAVEFSGEELARLGQNTRQQFEQLVLLNSNIVASFNQRIKAIENRISELERKA